MSTPRSAVTYARWSVIWRRKGRQYEKKFGTDLASAEELREKLLELGVPSRRITLRCTNVGFAPPDKYLPHYVWIKKQGRKVQVHRVPMRKLNAAGIWWCPYCRKMRKFQEGRDKVNGGRRRPYWACPTCRIRHTNHYVMIHNPVANHLAWEYPYNYKAPKVKK